MVLLTNEKNYPCTDMTQGVDSVSFAVAEEIQELGETVELQTDEGFVLYETTVAEWLRWTYANGILTLTNTPEPEPVPEPEPEPEEPTMAERVEELEAENKVLKAQVEALSEQHDFHEELIVELATIVYA